MVSVAIGIVVLLCFVYIGICVDRYYKERARLFRDIINYIERAAREVNFKKTDFITLTSCNSGNKMLDKVVGTIRGKITAGENGEISCPYLSKSEKLMLENFFKAISSGDYEAQKSIFAEYEDEFGRLCKIAEGEKTTKGKLYCKLVVLSGITLLILIV